MCYQGQTEDRFAKRKMVSGIKIEKFKEESWDSLERKNDPHGELEPTCARREACLSAPLSQVGSARVWEEGRDRKWEKGGGMSPSRAKGQIVTSCFLILFFRLLKKKKYPSSTQKPMRLPVMLIRT